MRAIPIAAVPSRRSGRGSPATPVLCSTAATRRSLALDLRRPEGQAVLRRLVAEADVFITNYPPPVRRRLGITYEELAPLNPRLIYASFTGYGETGPEADKPGFDATAWWARSGLMHLVRAGEEASPARSLPGMGDHPSAMGTYGAIVTALYQRERTGKGAYVGSSLLANGLWANGCSVQAALCGEKVVPQPPRERGVNALRIHYRCRDNRWILLSIAADEWRWDKFKACLDRQRSTIGRFATHASREANAPVLIPILDDIFATRDQAEWRRILDEAGLIFGIVADMDEIADDAQILASEALVPFTDGSSLTVNSPLWIAGQEKLPPRPAPDVGEHSERDTARGRLFRSRDTAHCARPASSAEIKNRRSRQRDRRQSRGPAGNFRPRGLTIRS